jgi:Domain of unknown function (DUF4394)
MRRLVQPGLIALLVVTALAAVPALASDWRAGDRSTIERSSANQSDPTAQRQIQQDWGIDASGQSTGTTGSDQGSGESSPSGARDSGRSSGYQAERYADPGQGLRVVGLTDDQRLVTFRSGSPSRVTTVGRIFGLKSDRSLVGIDYRVQDGKLYGVGDRGGVYTISTRNASVVKVSQLTVALDGQSFGVDFNPAANRLRVISNTGQNLRHNIDDPAGMPAAGTTATDTTLTYPPATGAATGVTGAGYTNNDLSSGTATTLFDLDTNLDQTAVQSPANAGTLAPTGKLLVDSDSSAGFDVYTGLRDGTAVSNTGFATLKVNGRYGLYQIGLLAGGAKFAGAFPSRHQVVDLAIRLNQG